MAHWRLWLLVSTYVLLGVAYYCYYTRWGPIDSLYFVAQTVTTVGACE